MTTVGTHWEQDESQSSSPAEPANGHSADESSAINAEADEDSQSSSTAYSSQSEVDRLNKELVDMREKYLRTMAEMDNMRKRLEREKVDFMKFSNESLLKDFVPVLDSFEKAIPAETAVDSNSSAFFEGFSMVRKQMLTTLSKYGLEPVESINKLFDPNVHQAIQRIESDVTNETVEAEFAKGYTLNGRLIRPAMVSVKVPR